MKKLFLLFALFAGFFGITSSTNAACPAPSLQECQDDVTALYVDCQADAETTEDTDACLAASTGRQQLCERECAAPTTTPTTTPTAPPASNTSCPGGSLDACNINVARVFANCGTRPGDTPPISGSCRQDKTDGYADCQSWCPAATQVPATGFPITVTGNGASSTGGTAPVTLTNPLGTTDIRLLIARVISAVLSIIGVIALLMFVYGGFLWMISGGNEGQVEKGKEVLKWTTLGIILIVSAYVIVNAIFRAAFTGAL